MEHSRKDCINRAFALLASAALVMGLMPSIALADTESKEPLEESAAKAEPAILGELDGQGEELAVVKKSATEAESTDQAPESPVFSQSVRDYVVTMIDDQPIYWDYTGYEGEATLEKCFVPSSVTSVEIPSELNGYSVTSIGANAFKNCNSLVSVTIPSSVTYIGSSAFEGCTSLASITIPASVERIGDYAFLDCTSLASVRGMKRIIDWTGFENNMFNGCINLKDVYYYSPEAAWNQIQSAFPDDITVHYMCGDNLEWVLTNGVLTISGAGAMFDYGTGFYETTPWKDLASSIESIVIGDGVTSIGAYAFYKCTSLESVKIPTSVTSIGEYTFRRCAKLQNVYYDGSKDEWDKMTRARMLFFAIDPEPMVHFSYNVTFVDEDGVTVLKDPTKYYAGTKATDIEKPDVPAKITPQYIYTFAGWSPEVADVTEDATYKATYDKKLSKYKVTFVDEDGSVLQSDEVEYDKTPAYTDKTPTKAADDKRVYEFAGWSPEVAPVTADVVYKATYTAKDKYACGEGSSSAWAKGSTDALNFTFKRFVDDETTLDHFKGVEIDGKLVPEKDASGKANWIAKKGSLILSLQPEYLETLADGDHTVKTVFDDGAGEVTFEVTAKPAPASERTRAATPSSSASTGDTLPLAAVMAALLLSSTMLVVSRRKLRVAHSAKRGKHAR